MTGPTAKQLSEAIIGQIETVFNVRDRAGREECAKVVDGLIEDYGDRRARQDGEIVSGAREPDDPGSAVYFELRGKKVCLACDQWRELWENLYAIGRTIEAMRAIDRWGVSDLLDRMFTGFIALTDDAGKSWPSILGVSGDATREQIKAAYREKMKSLHPDKGGTVYQAAELNEAYSRALEEVAK